MPVQCLNREKFRLIGHFRGKESKPLDSKVYTKTSDEAIRVGIRLMLQLGTYISQYCYSWRYHTMYSISACLLTQICVTRCVCLGAFTGRLAIAFNSLNR